MDRVRVGIIGTGGIAQGHIRRLLANPNAEITALCDVSEKALANTAERNPSVAALPQYADYREMITAGNLDAVEICTPHTLHFEQIITSLESGLHVLSEKPMVCKVSHAHDVIKKIEETGKVFVLNYQRHYQAEFLYIRDKIASGEFGEVQFVQGLQGQEWLRAVAGTWRHDPALSGGGQLNDSGSHMLAVLLFATGLSVKRCNAFIDNLGAAVDINSALTIEFEGGAQGSISVVGNGPSFYEDITIWCSKGAFYMRNGKLEVSDALGKRHFPALDEMPKGSDPDQNFIAAIRGTEPIGCPASFGLRVIEWTEAAWQSAEKRETVTVDRS